MKKLISVTVILLFIGLAFAPSIDANEEIISYSNFLIEIQNITGGFGIHADVVSGTHKNLTEVEWKISFSSGGWLLIGKQRTGMIDTLHAGETIKIWSFVFGIFGRGLPYDIRFSIFYEDAEIYQRDAIAEVVGPFVRDVRVDPH